MSDSSDSEVDTSSKTKTKKPTVFDNNVFDAEESDEKTKSINRKKKVNQSQTHQQTKKPILKTNNEQIKKEKLPKINNEQPTTKKKITISKTTDKKKVTVNSTKSTSKTTISAQKRPSTDESNESTKKLKFDDEKSKSTSIEEQTPTIQTESEISTSNKPSIVITSAKTESSTNLPKIDEPSMTTNPQTTPTKFGIVFTSHHRHSTTTPSSTIRTQSTETKTTTSHETSKNDDEDMDDDNESVPNNNNNTTNKNEQISSNTNTLKPPVTGQHPLSDDETLNPETMQLSDLIGASRREGPKSVQSRSTNKTTGKGKRTTKQDISSNKRQQTKINTKTNQSKISNEKRLEPSTNSTLVPSTEKSPSILTNTKRLSTTESSSILSPNNNKEVKRLRKSIDDLTSQSQIKLEPIENRSQWTNTQVKEETNEPTVSSAIHKQEIPPPLTSSVIDQSQITSMETDQIPSSSSSSSIITSTKSPSTTSAETENAIKALYSTIQISQQSISKTPTAEKSSPIIAPISKETLPIVEHQPKSKHTPSRLPSHVPFKSSLTSATFSMFVFLNISYDVIFLFR
jgi:hypothetical protein